MEELISVIVSVYNTEKVLARTLTSIANQTYRNIEIILVDDGSTDSSGMICDHFALKEPRCRVIHKPNGGQGSAKNVGQKVATGDYLFFPDGDDVFNLDFLRILHDAIQNNPEYDLAFVGFEMVNEQGHDTTPPNCAKKEIKKIEYTRKEMIQGLFGKEDDRFVYGWNKLYRKDLLNNLWCGDYPRHQDFDFNFRVFLKVRKAVFVHLKLYYWVQRSESKTHQPDTWGLYYKSRTSILYNNWINLSPECYQFGHYLLDALYRTMVFWEEWSRKSGYFSEVKTICSDYRKKTIKAYVKNKSIRLGRKIACLTMLAFPPFSHLMMKLTHNAR